MSISEADLIDVYLATFDARAKWRNILLFLRVSNDTLNSIGERWQDSPDDCYREGLSEWLKGGERSWEDVVKALSSPIVGHGDIARTIETDHVLSTGASASSTAVEATVHMPEQQKVGDHIVIYSTEKIGNGAFGAVFKGSYRGGSCAVKVLLHDALQIQMNLPAGQERGRASDAFDRECEFLKSFKHLNVVQHLSTDKHPVSGSTLLVTELMDCNLRSYISGLGEESLSSRCEISLSKDVASGLAYIHSRRIIHRDLCGDNILLILSQPIPLAKISDFGMSRLLDPSQLSSTLTAIGHRMGYLPNEALRMDNESYDYSLDVFSFGVIMVQIVCKQETIKSAKDRSFHISRIPWAHKLKPFIDNCLQEDMRRRPSARHLCAALEEESRSKVEEMDTQPAESEDHVIQEGRLSTPASGGATKLSGAQRCQNHRPELVQGPPPGKLRPALTLKWRRGKDMPIKMTQVKSVVIDNAVFVGGGFAENKRDRCTVMKLDLQQDRWTRLLAYTAKFFALTAIYDQLIVVGGCDERTEKPTNQIALFQSGIWTHPYQPMKIARHSSTAVSFKCYIIVAGGQGDQGRISSVEVLDVTAGRWFTVPSLPEPQFEMKSTLIRNTLYLMGGYDHTVSETKMVTKVDLNKLIAGTSGPFWQKIEDAPLECSAPLSNSNSLLAVGGRDDNNESNSSIHVYQFNSRRWLKVGDLPTARYNCTCSVLPNGEVMVAGGKSNFSYLNTIDFVSISNQ